MFQLLDADRYQVSTPLDCPERYLDGPEYQRNAFYIMFAPVYSMWEQCKFVFICACDIASEHTHNRAPSGDADDTRMAFGF